MALDQNVRDQMSDIMTRYPEARSAVMPMLHLAQSVEDEITPEAMRVIADMLGLTAAEVTAVATFYTMYKRRPVGKHHIGVCTNTLCAMLGGDAVYAALSERLGIGHNERDVDGTFWLERIECQAACTHAPVMTVDWEFMDDVTPASAVDVIDRLANGEVVPAVRRSCRHAAPPSATSRRPSTPWPSPSMDSRDSEAKPMRLCGPVSPSPRSAA